MTITSFTLLLPYFQRTLAFSLEDLVGDKVTNLLDPTGLTLLYLLKNFFYPFFNWECKDNNFFYSTKKMLIFFNLLFASKGICRRAYPINLGEQR
jgi:hypothetical protein